MKSTPIHEPLAWDPRATAHLLWVAGDGEALLRRLMAQPRRGELTLIHVDGPAPDEADVASALTRLALALAGAHMGTRLYVAAPEDLIWRVWNLATAQGLSREQFRSERLGSGARPVYCVHCRQVTRSVRTNIAACAGCRRQLCVREHFSRRLGAYMGFQIDAELPGELPAIHEAFL